MSGAQRIRRRRRARTQYVGSPVPRPSYVYSGCGNRRAEGGVSEWHAVNTELLMAGFGIKYRMCEGCGQEFQRFFHKVGHSVVVNSEPFWPGRFTLHTGVFGVLGRFLSQLFCQGHTVVSPV